MKDIKLKLLSIEPQVLKEDYLGFNPIWERRTKGFRKSSKKVYGHYLGIPYSSMQEKVFRNNCEDKGYNFDLNKYLMEETMFTDCMELYQDGDIEAPYLIECAISRVICEEFKNPMLLQPKKTYSAPPPPKSFPRECWSMTRSQIQQFFSDNPNNEFHKQGSELIERKKKVQAIKNLVETDEEFADILEELGMADIDWNKVVDVTAFGFDDEAQKKIDDTLKDL